jgi:uncharacterized membrane protein YqjE
MADDAGQDQPAHARGLFGSLKALLATLLAIGHNRLELFSTELQEEIARAASILLWGMAALLLGVLAILLAAFAIVLAIPEEQRALVLALVAAGSAVAAVVAGLVSRNRTAAKARPFDATLTELAKDREDLTR